MQIGEEIWLDDCLKYLVVCAIPPSKSLFPFIVKYKGNGVLRLMSMVKPIVTQANTLKIGKLKILNWAILGARPILREVIDGAMGVKK